MSVSDDLRMNDLRNTRLLDSDMLDSDLLSSVQRVGSDPLAFKLQKVQTLWSGYGEIARYMLPTKKSSVLSNTFIQAPLQSTREAGIVHFRTSANFRHIITNKRFISASQCRQVKRLGLLN